MAKVTEYKGTKNDLVIGLVNRFVISDGDKTVVISLTKNDKGFLILQYGFNKEGEEIENLNLISNPFKKKYYAMKDIKGMIKKYLPTYGEKKVYPKRK